MDLLSSLRRRWVLACSLLLLALAGTGYAQVKLAPTYQSTSSVVLLAPKNAAKLNGGNPYLAFDSSLNQTADVVRYETNDPRTVSLLASRGDTATYLVTDATDTSGPVLIVTVTSKNKAMVMQTLQAVTKEITTKLDGLQTGITPPNKIHALVITFNEQPTQLKSKKTRTISVVAAAGVALSIIITLIVDAILIRRRSTRHAQNWEEDFTSGGDPARIPQQSEADGPMAPVADGMQTLSPDMGYLGVEGGGDQESAARAALRPDLESRVGAARRQDQRSRTTIRRP